MTQLAIKPFGLDIIPVCYCGDGPCQCVLSLPITVSSLNQPCCFRFVCVFGLCFQYDMEAHMKRHFLHGQMRDHLNRGNWMEAKYIERRMIDSILEQADVV